MLRETKTTRHRCEFANSVDSKSKRRKRAQQHRLQERMLQVNKQGDWRDVVVRVVPKVHFPERRINRFFSKSIAEGIRCGPTKGATFEPNEDSQAKKSDQGCKETKKNGCETIANNFFNSLLTECIRCGPTRELRINPTRILKQRNLIKDAKKTKKTGAKKCKKTSSIPCSPRLRRISRKTITK